MVPPGSSGRHPQPPEHKCIKPTRQSTAQPAPNTTKQAPTPTSAGMRPLGCPVGHMDPWACGARMAAVTRRRSALGRRATGGILEERLIFSSRVKTPPIAEALCFENKMKSQENEGFVDGWWGFQAPAGGSWLTPARHGPRNEWTNGRHKRLGDAVALETRKRIYFRN